MSYKVTPPPHLQSGGPAKLGQLLRSNVSLMLNDVGMSVRARVRQPITRHPGADSLYNQITLDRSTQGSLLVRVATTKKEAIFREVDTKAHIILPRNARVLYFKPKGSRRSTRGGAPYGVFAMIVHHPGTRGTHSWQYGALAMQQRLKWGMKYAMDATFQGTRYSKRYS